MRLLIAVVLLLPIIIAAEETNVSKPIVFPPGFPNAPPGPAPPNAKSEKADCTIVFHARPACYCPHSYFSNEFVVILVCILAFISGCTVAGCCKNMAEDYEKDTRRIQARMNQPMHNV